MSTSELSKVEPRAYRNDWTGEHYPLETPFGVVTLQPLGWGIRVESRRETVYVNGERVHVEDPPLRINGRDCMMGQANYTVDAECLLRPTDYGHGQVVPPERVTFYGGSLTPNAEAKLRELLPDLVAQWLMVPEHRAAFLATREAYVSNQARTCEESIRELEDALDVFRGRLVAIEAGDLSPSPYINGGRRLTEAYE